MKALILAGGRGKRLEGITENVNKCMLKLNGKPLIQYNIDRAIEAGANEIIIVVGYRGDDIVNHFGKKYKDVKITYVNQPEQKGLVHAMECAKYAIGKDDFLLVLGDEILIKANMKGMSKKFKDEKLFGVCGVVDETDKKKISKTYAVIVNEDGGIFRIIEKPRNPILPIQGTGHCMFKNEILNYIQYTPINYARQEKELPDLIQCAIDDGKTVKIFVFAEKYTNVNSDEDLKEAEKLVR